MKSLINWSLAGAILLLATPDVVSAQDSKEFALMSRVAWSAFECSILAEKAENQKEQERHFLLGYEQGKKFVEAVHGQKVDRFDISNTTPWGFSMRLEGPSSDFVVGRLYETLSEYVYKKLYTDVEIDNVSAVIRSRAEQLYRERNCSLLGLKN